MPQATAEGMRHLRSRARANNRRRAEWLIAVTTGTLTIHDVIDHAATEDGKPLRRITLRQLLLAQPGHGTKRVATILNGLADRLGETSDPDNWTIAWLLDPRAGGKRFLCWLDLHHPITNPWPGFPFAPRPPLR